MPTLAITANRFHPVRPTVQNVFHLVVAPFVCRCSWRFFYGVRVRRSRRPYLGPSVVACNHRSYFDPACVGAFADRALSYFARENLWRNPAVALFLRTLGGLPINRNEPQLAVMKRAVAWLKEGRSVLIFPEGTRTCTGRLGPMQDGPALFARRAGVPVLPVYIYGSEVAWPRGYRIMRLGEVPRTLEIRYGPPLFSPAHLPPRLADRVVSEALRRWMLKQEQDLLGPAAAAQAPSRGTPPGLRTAGCRTPGPSQAPGHA